MFEKDAEEIANKKLCATTMCYNRCNFNSPKHHRCGDWHRCYEIAKDGAEFGYNKANEWHYVEEGDLPKGESGREKVYAIFKNKSYYIVDRAAVKNYEDLIAWTELPTFKRT